MFFMGFMGEVKNTLKLTVPKHVIEGYTKLMPQKRRSFTKQLLPSRDVFSEQFFPARPRRILSKARKLAKMQIGAAQKFGLPIASNAQYIKWLKKESMLGNAHALAIKYSGKGRMWQNPFAKPRPRAAVKLASVWYTAYPISLISKPGSSLLETFADEKLWEAFQEIGIKGMHTGPMKRAGGVSGWDATPSIDGHFDRISTNIDAMFGNEKDFKLMTEVASRHGGTIIDDIVPGHTGKGADFRLAEMNYREYPGIYHMVEIHPGDWYVLPDVPRGKDSVNIDAKTEAELKIKGYIIGKLPRVIFYEPGVKETNWSATRAVRGVDGVKRRWVYLHYFKDGQPSINWLDPSFAGMKLVIGDALHSLGELGSRGLRLDANGFLGIEKSSENEAAWSEGHPLSGVANQLISGMVRKLGGFTFQELNLSIDHIKTMSELGADLSYDFVNRPAYHHAMATADTEFLRLTLRTALDIGVDPASLVHALQNHDELTYELVHFWTLHKDDIYDYHGKKLTGLELCNVVRRDLKNVLVADGIEYNKPFTENGIACTTASVITASLGIQDVSDLDDKDIKQIQRAHLLLAMFNALQPGVFALSGWDLAGSLTVDPESIKDLLQDGDTRWINRGAYDLMGLNPGAKQSSSGMPVAVSLYGTLPDQLAKPKSFANQLKHILAVREEYGIATSHQLEIPEVTDKRLLAMVHRLTDERLQVTVLNFSGQHVSGKVESGHLVAGMNVKNLLNDERLGKVAKDRSFEISLEPYEGACILIEK